MGSRSNDCVEKEIAKYKNIRVEIMKGLSNDVESLEYLLETGEIFYNIKYEYREDKLIYNDNGDLIDSYRIYVPVPKVQINEIEESMKNDSYFSEEEIIIAEETLAKFKAMNLYEDLIRLEELLNDSKVNKLFKDEDICDFKRSLSGFNKGDIENKGRGLHLFCKSLIKDNEHMEKIISMYTDYVGAGITIEHLEMELGK